MGPMRSRRIGRARATLIASVLATLAGIAQAQSGDAAPPPPAAPRLEIEKPEIHLGSISRGEPAECRFALKNTGDDVLRILHVKPG